MARRAGHLKKTNDGVCMCVCVCIYIYIYIYPNSLSFCPRVLLIVIPNAMLIEDRLLHSFKGVVESDEHN
jgi:hypothetical protein